MRTLRVYYPKLTTKKQGNKIAILDEQQIRHMHVLRVDSLDYKFEGVNGEGLKAELKLVKLTKSDAVFKILNIESEVNLVKNQGILVFPIIKQGNLENAISQVTQFNFYSHILLYFSEFSRYSEKKYSDNKMKRLEKLVKAAFVQSQSVIKPIISLKQSLREAVELIEKNSREDSEDLQYVVPDTGSGAQHDIVEMREMLCSEGKTKQDYVVIIGAEAGFSKGEYEVLSDIDVKRDERGQVKYVKLGNSILRSETAAVAVTSILR